MKNQFVNNPGDHNQEVQNSIEKLNKISSSSSIFTTPKEVWNTIKVLPVAKAPGYDKIPNSALKHLPKVAIMELTHIYTSCLRLAYFPTKCKWAEIVMIPKPGKDHGLPGNYRPISQLTTMSKVFEIILLEYLKKFIKPRHEQHTFRPEHSTTTQLVKLTDDLVVNVNNKKTHSCNILGHGKGISQGVAERV